jgi:restriction system protein
MKTFKYKYDDLFNPTLEALGVLGGSGTVSEIDDKVSEILSLSEDELEDIHRGNRTKFSYRMAWARNYLKRFDAIENSQRGIWALTDKGKMLKTVSKTEVKKFVVSLNRSIEELPKASDRAEQLELPIDVEWQEILLEEVRKIHPDQFERLCQRLLRELGFIDVEVTGKSGDGGIDGRGILRLGGVLSFHVAFQAKRYQGSVSSSTIRDFRGAIMGRADKGIILTTGSFTRDAKREAQRDGATPIDLIDGLDLAQKLKELRLGVDIELVEQVNIKSSWFTSL